MLCSPGRRRCLIRLTATISLSAFLLFLIQPIAARRLLPHFGGSAAVWTACLTFFQIMLVAGYAYAHGLASMKPRTQAALHIALLVASLAFIPFDLTTGWIETGRSAPALRVLGELVWGIGAPILLIASTSPLLQRWYSLRVHHSRPYRLYALSNAASVLALLAYPFLFEPLSGVSAQVTGWSVGYVAFVVLTSASAIQFATSPTIDLVQGSRPQWRAAEAAFWFALPAAATMLLPAVTNYACQELSVMPFLWMVPLLLYLSSYILCFSGSGQYRRGLWAPVFFVTSAATALILISPEELPVLARIILLFTSLFAACMVCHGELVRRKPHPSELTRFYLISSVGGATGGAFVTFAAPALFDGYWELQLGLLLSAVLFWASTFEEGDELSTRPWVQGGALLSLLTLIPALLASLMAFQPNTLWTHRDFFGVIRVEEFPGGGTMPAHNTLMHGRTRHGLQFKDPSRALAPTTYYGPSSGAGLAILRHPVRLARLRGDSGWRPMRVGVVGLGVGTLATYALEGDEFRFYEISEGVERAARKYFTYLSASQGETTVVLGDARVQISQEGDQRPDRLFDVLVVDAFSGSTIPVHLLTAEALDLYRRHLAPGGILAIHTSSGYFDLSSVIHRYGLSHHIKTMRIRNAEDWDARAISASDWVLVSANPEFNQAIGPGSTPWDEPHTPRREWTDDYSSPMSVLRL